MLVGVHLNSLNILVTQIQIVTLIIRSPSAPLIQSTHYAITSCSLLRTVTKMSLQAIKRRDHHSQIFWRKVRIALGHYDCRMTEHVANLGERHTTRHQPGRTSVTEIVDPKIRNSHTRTGRGKCALHVQDARAGFMGKYPRRIGAELRAKIFSSRDCAARFLIERQRSPLAGFCVTTRQVDKLLGEDGARLTRASGAKVGRINTQGEALADFQFRLMPDRWRPGEKDGLRFYTHDL